MLENFSSTYQTSPQRESVNQCLSGAQFEFIADSKGRHFLRKRFSGEITPLIHQYRWMKKHHHLPEFPEVKNPRRSDNHFSYDIEWIPRAQTMADYLMTNPESAPHMVDSVFNLFASHIYTQESTSANLDWNWFFEEKLFRKWKSCALDRPGCPLLESDSITINMKRYKNFLPIWKKWSRSGFKVLSSNLNLDDQFNIHGDLTLENILITPKREIFIIDPNPFCQIRHPANDLGKLFQSLGSQFERHRKIDIMLRNTELRFSSNTSKNLLQLQKRAFQLFHAKFNISWLEAQIHEMIHFARLLPYVQKNNRNHFLWSYGRFIKLMNAVENMSKSEEY